MDEIGLTECKQSAAVRNVCALLASQERPLGSLFHRFNHTVDRIINDDDGPDTRNTGHKHTPVLVNKLM